MRIPRIFVGTLACGEAELDACTASIAAQTDVAVTHYLIKDQPEWEAHNLLWEAWGKRRTHHDIFAKIDADTILNRTTALAEIAAYFGENPRLTGMQPLLDDYFTDMPIVGPLTVFSPKVIFQKAKSKLFVDHADSGHDLVLKGENIPGLSPVGYHGQTPNPRQAFHFGFHRQLKRQHDVIAKTARAWLAHRDASREWALAGAACVRWWMRGKTHYASSVFQARFERMAAEDLRRETVFRFVRKLNASCAPTHEA